MVAVQLRLLVTACRHAVSHDAALSLRDAALCRNVIKN